MIRIQLLGGLAVTADGAPLTGAAAQARRLAVLAVIARAGERGVTRERLLALLWPDADEAGGRAALSQALHVLRRDAGTDELFLGVQSLRLNGAVATCDVVEFEQAVESGAWERAVRTYRGPWLEGFRVPGADELDRWMEEERADLARRHADALERLARSVADTDPAAAAGWWRKRAALEPLNARVTVQLMRALAAAGEGQAALQQARIYEALLEQELALPPDADVMRCAAELRHALENPRAAPAADLPPPVAAPASVEPSPRNPRPAGRPRRRWPLVAAGIAALAAVGAIVAVAAARRVGPAPSASLLAVGGIVDYRIAGPSGGAALADMLATHLSLVDGIQVVSRARLLELAERASGTMESPAALAQAARDAGARELVEGGLHRLGEGRLLLELRRVDLASGAVRTAYRLEGGDPLELVERATGEIAASLGRAAGARDPGAVSSRSLVAYRFYEEGLRSYVSGDYRAARRLFGAALDEDSTFAMAAFYRLRSAVFEQPDPGEVARLTRLASHASDRERLVILGSLAVASNSSGLAAIAETLIVRYPAEVDAHFFAGFARVGRGEYAAALPYLHQVLAMDSAALEQNRARCLACEALQQLIYSYQALDSLARAEELARVWTRRNPQAQVAWAALATVLIGAGRHDEALAARARATATPFDRYDGVFPALVDVFAGRFEAADRRLRGLLETATGDAEQWQARWILLLSIRHQRRWEAALQLARAEPPARDTSTLAAEQRRGLRLIRALVYLDSGATDAAVAVLDSLIAAPGVVTTQGGLARRQVLHHTLLAEAAADAGDVTRLRAAADSAAAWAGRSDNPRDGRIAQHARALVLLVEGDTAGAMARFGDAVTSPTLGFTRTNLRHARLLLRQGRAAEAVPLLRAGLRGSLEALNLYATHTDFHELLAEAYDSLGAADSARAHRAYVAAAVR